MQKVKQTIIWAALFISITLSFVILLSYINSVHPFFDSLADIRIALSILAIITALPLLFSQFRRQSVMLIVFVVAVLSTTVSDRGKAKEAISSGQPTYSHLQINLRFDRADKDKFLNLIAEHKPDFISYQEASSHWEPVLQILEQNGYYRRECRRDHSPLGATGILTRYAFIDQPDTCFQDAAHVMGRVRLENNQQLDIHSLHLFWPWPHRQQQQIESLSLDNPFVPNNATLIAGDFNAVTWSHTVRQIEDLSATKHIGIIGPTWLSYKLPDSWRPLLGLPIDNILLSDKITLIDVQKLTTIGSDHLPVLIMMQLQ